jgi:hypothetical protein
MDDGELKTFHGAGGIRELSHGKTRTGKNPRWRSISVDGKCDHRIVGLACPE